MIIGSAIVVIAPTKKELWKSPTGTKGKEERASWKTTFRYQQRKCSAERTRDGEGNKQDRNDEGRRTKDEERKTEVMGTDREH